jgi:hypothetical protein
MRPALMAAAQLARSADVEHYAETCDSAQRCEAHVAGIQSGDAQPTAAAAGQQRSTSATLAPWSLLPIRATCSTRSGERGLRPGSRRAWNG